MYILSSIRMFPLNFQRAVDSSGIYTSIYIYTRVYIYIHEYIYIYTNVPLIYTYV
jgi:hypothetical protein